MSFYKKHIFFCTNKRADGSNRPSCGQCNAEHLRKYAKNKVKSLNFDNLSDIRINSAGCLDLCEKGPIMVIYPENIWYSYFDQHDVDEIIEQHIKQGNVVTRLQLLPNKY